MITVSQIFYNPNEILGRGTTSIVYAGIFQARSIAVKKVKKQNQHKLIQREVDLLIKSDNHPNIIRYFLVVEDECHQYIALEQCQFTVADYVNSSEIQSFLSKKDLIWKVFQGMKRLHEIGIVHRDIKPSNILLLELGPTNYEVKISDFGYSKDIGISSSQMSMCLDGSNFFLPPESQNMKFNSKSDIYMVGGLVYFIYKNGTIALNSPFQWKADQEENCDDDLIKHLILIMTKENFQQRPSMYCLCYHPYFWSNQKILDFLIDISNRLELRDYGASSAVNAFGENKEFVIKGNWLNALDDAVRQTLPHRNRMNYDGYAVDHLIRALRNKKNHYDDMSNAAKKILGPIPDGFTGYWIDKFPKLVLHVYLKWKQSGLSTEENYKQFYPDPNCN